MNEFLEFLAGCFIAAFVIALATLITMWVS